MRDEFDTDVILASTRVHEEADQDPSSSHAQQRTEAFGIGLDDYYDYFGRGDLFGDCELGGYDSCDEDYQHLDTSRKHHDPAYSTANESYSGDPPDRKTRDEQKAQSGHEDPDLSC